MKKCFSAIMALSLLAGVLLSCSDGSNGGNEEGLQETGAEGSGVTLRTSKVRFDFAGAKAVAKLESSSSSSRAAATGDELSDIVKILADGSMQNAITVASDSELSNIVAVYKSPLATSNDVFVVFESSVTLGSEQNATTGVTTYTHLGQLVCVHEDGTVLDVLNVESSSESTEYEGKYIALNTNSIQFDVNGNLYFSSRTYDTYGYKSNSYNLNGEESTGEVIYQFNPSTNEITEMVAAVADTYYEQMQLDNAGDWIFVSGRRGSASFLRAIPVNNPNYPVNILYSSSYGGVNSWIYDDNARIMYFTGNDGNRSGLFTATKAGGFKDKTYKGCSIGENFEWKLLDSFYDNYESYSWSTNAKTDGIFNAEKTLDSLLKGAYTVTAWNTSTQSEELLYLTSKMVDIRFDAYINGTGARRALALLTNGKKNAAALRVLDSNIGRAALYSINKYEEFGKNSYGSGTYGKNFFEDILYVKDTDTLLKDSDAVLFSYTDYEGTAHEVTAEDIFERDTPSYHWDDFFYSEDIVRPDEGSYTGGTRFTYGFSKTFCNDTTLDTSTLLEYLFSYCNVDGTKEFRLTSFKDDETYGALYSTRTDEAALTWLASDVDRMNLFGKLFLSNSSSFLSDTYSYVSFMNFISKTCFIAGTDTKATYWGSGYDGWTDSSDTDKYYRNRNITIEYSSIRDFTVNENGLFGVYSNLLWGNTDDPYFYSIQIADSTGKLVEQQNKLPLPSGKVVNSQSYTERLLLQYALTDSEGAELGYHHIYSMELESGKVINCFDNVPNRNGLEVVSFSAVGELLYYSAVRGTTVENGIVDIVNDAEYAPLSITRKMVAVYTFN